MSEKSDVKGKTENSIVCERYADEIGRLCFPLYLEFHLLMVGKGGGYCGICVHNDLHYHYDYTYNNNKKVTPTVQS